MGQELRPDQIKPLADAIGDAFSTAELDGIVRQSTGDGLFKEWVGEGDPHRVIAHKLLIALEEHGRARLFLAHVLSRAPALRDLIKRGCPAALTTPIEIRNQVPLVLAGLKATQATLQDPAVKARLATSRESLEAVARQIDSLESYKKMHDCLHQLQMKPFSYLRSIAKRLAQDPFYPGLREYLEQLQTSCENLHSLPDGLPDSPPWVKKIEIDWIDKLQKATDIYQSALDASDAQAMRDATNEVRAVMRYQPVRLNNMICLTAQTLPLEKLMQALLEVSSVVGPERAELNTAYESMRDLRATLLGRVAEHNMWQEADNKIWLLEETLAGASNEAREDFEFDWPAAKDAILFLADMDPNAKWSQRIHEYSMSLDDELAREEEVASRALENSFDAYRREARVRFFRVDKLLRGDCEALVRIGKPLLEILEDLR